MPSYLPSLIESAWYIELMVPISRSDRPKGFILTTKKGIAKLWAEVVVVWHITARLRAADSYKTYRLTGSRLHFFWLAEFESELRCPNVKINFVWAFRHAKPSSPKMIVTLLLPADATISLANPKLMHCF